MSRILVADDDPEQLHPRRALLETVGHRVDVALSPPETVREIERGQFDLVIMDLRFPNEAGVPDSQQGLALIRQIRKLGCRIPVIVLSGWPDDLYGQPEEAMVSRVMVKPVRIATLLEAIGDLVR